MDLTLEDLLFDAWAAIRPRLIADRDELRARLARGRARYAERPLRAWCLCVRANDTRINAATAACVPDDYDRPDPQTGQLRPHRVTLDAELLRQICPPVWLESPGQRVKEVCALLGIRQVSQLQAARLQGRFDVHYVDHLGGAKGAVPLLYTPRPLDPAALLFDKPDPVWTWTAHYIGDRIPDDVSQDVERVGCQVMCRMPTRPGSHTRRLPPPPPDYVEYKRHGEHLEADPILARLAAQRAYHREWRQRNKLAHPTPRKPLLTEPTSRSLGWRWVCPGCRRTARKLYYPLTPINLLRHVAADLVSVDHAAADASAPLPCFACQTCHKVAYLERVMHFPSSLPVEPA